MTLLEVVIALAIFMVASSGIFLMITQSKRLSDNSRDHYQAINLAKNRLERARFLPVSTLPLLVGTNYVNVNGAVIPSEQEHDAIFRMRTWVTPLSPNLTEVIVTVDIRNRLTWNFGSGSNAVKEVLRTYFTEYYTP